jgi:hypothetical protein
MVPRSSLLGYVLAALLASTVQAQEVDWKTGALAHLVPFIGTYSIQEVLDDPVAAAALARLVPDAARADIPRNLQVAGPIDFISGYLVISGNAVHAGGEDEAQVWLKVYDGSAIVVLTRGGVRTLYAGESDYSYLPRMLRAQLATQPGDILATKPPALLWHGRE